eukprot:CAMPEP_0173306350 /NCGR_PEP_ID=MMETSP1143-20121109/20521_1 /TAXON_ID=483371 /ORGANISM="non described non described, Strain CCMP2298" /LENGTH=38 /DNA_ID= /DNA_START= /DNA_END= /DNA_ORIENTATION=
MSINADVQVAWADGASFAGTVTAVHADGSCDVLYAAAV